MPAGQAIDALRSDSPDSPLHDPREVNTQLFLAALTAQESGNLATEAQRQQVRLLAVVEHELRNPLTPLRIVTDLLVDRGATGAIPIERLREIIDRQVTRMDLPRSGRHFGPMTGLATVFLEVPASAGWSPEQGQFVAVETIAQPSRYNY
jgi:hypothetical protein